VDEAKQAANAKDGEIAYGEHLFPPAGEPIVGKATVQSCVKKAMNEKVKHLQATSRKADADNLRRDLEGFQKLFNHFVDSVGQNDIVWDKIEPLPANAILQHSTMSAPTDVVEIKRLLSSLVVVKLNGGLGTSMGCQGPKSLIDVRQGLNFLDMAVNHIRDFNEAYGVDIPLVLMNSFNTECAIQEQLAKYKDCGVTLHTFQQSCYPRIKQLTLMPIAENCDVESDKDAWYPPGHGDFFNAFYVSGMLEKFKNAGKKVIFVSNIDNTGAQVDFAILNEALKGRSYIMEMTPKTEADVKGGTLIGYDNHVQLLEVAQVPTEHMKDFSSIKKFKTFNTNNIWLNLEGKLCKVIE
jgi:UTP--glucose-1-phosphate uridylyltransferase